MHLNLSLLQPGQLRSSWRLTERDPFAYLDAAAYRRLVRIAEAATIDAVFMGDAPALGPIASSPSASLDPPILMSHLSAVTERLGFVATSTTTYNHPYNLARRYSALDHVSGGRAAVNLVTTYDPSAALNFGYTEAPAKEVRYRRAREFLEVITALWGSWEPEALLGDRASGRWADPERVHPIEHDGEFFRVHGALNIPPTPQGRPVIVQAGGSDAGLELAGDFADVVFTAAQTKEKALAFREDIRRRAAAAGRDPDTVKISLGVVVITDATELAARERERRLYGTIDMGPAAAGVLRGLGVDPTRFGPDDRLDVRDLPDDPIGAAPVGFQLSTRALLAQRPMTPRELVHGSAGGNGHRLIVGAPEQIADELEQWHAVGAADGFTVMGADTAADFPNFAEHVVPLLQDRGLFHREYPGSTLRDSLGLPSPVGLSPTSGPRELEGAFHG